MHSTSADPLIWALIGPKHGDNAQVRALAAGLAAATGARVEERLLRYRAAELLVHAWPWPTLAGVEPGCRAGLRPPWPDLVIGAGRRSEPVAHWLRRQSGGTTRLVHLGRPWSAPGRFDLVVTSSQYAVPAAANVLELALPLAAPAPVGAPAAADSLAPGHAAARWPFEDLPRPWTGVLLGGDSGFLLFDAERARALAERLNASIAATGGSLVLIASPRTPPAFVDALEPALRGAWYLHRWSPDAPNPYRTMLASADALIVTSDSVSMTVEAIAAGKPAYLYDVRPRGRDWWRHLGEYRWRSLSHRLVQALAPRRFRRDVGRIHERLVGQGSARWLADAAWPFRPVPLDPSADLAVAVTRARRLLAGRCN